jgi:peptidoglycan/LPS O-acetylase OafA/YrhL
MIQRIQSIYLLVVALATGVLPFWLPLWYTADLVEIFAASELWILLVFLGGAALALIALFSFKTRQHQFVLNRFNILLNLFLLGSFVFRTLKLSGEAAVSEKGIGLLIPVFSIVLLVLANKAIRKDEELVKSVDRLR